MARVKTLEEAYEFVHEVKVCTIFAASVAGVPSLWDAVDLPERGGGRTKWGPKVEAVWKWKNELPETYPDDVFYGKIQGGHAVLMSMDYLRNVHYRKAMKPISDCSELARTIYEIVRLSPCETGSLRKEVISLSGCTKSRFDTALKQLQITLNIVRSNEPGLANDTWLPFSELYVGLMDD